MYRIVGYESSGMVKLIADEAGVNRLGHIAYCPDNRGYLITLRQLPSGVDAHLIDLLNDQNAAVFEQYHGAGRPQYLAKWLFYELSGEIFYGTPPILPNPFEAKNLVTAPWNAVILRALTTLYPLLVDELIQNNILFDHVSHLLGVNGAQSAINSLVMSLLQRAVRDNDYRCLAYSEALLSRKEIQESIKATSMMDGSVVSVRDGLIHTTNRNMPQFGDLYKFDLGKHLVFALVQEVNYSYPLLSAGPNTLRVLKDHVLTKNVVFRPLATKIAETGKMTSKVVVYPDYGTPSLKLSGEDVRCLYPGEALLGYMGEYEVRFDVKQLRARSAGIFGKSGTGKSTLAHLLAAQMIQHGETLLIFDEHQEFSDNYMLPYRTTSFDAPQMNEMYGLRTLFGSKVCVVALGKNRLYKLPDGTTREADFTIRLPLSDIDPSDIEQIAEQVNISQAGINALNVIAQLIRRKKMDYPNFVEAVLNLRQQDRDLLVYGASEEDLAGDDGNGTARIHEQTLNALRRSFERLFRDSNGDYREIFDPENSSNRDYGMILDTLRKGTSCIINMPSQEAPASSLLAINVLFREIIRRWKNRLDEKNTTENRHLTIFIEEAHRLIPRGRYTRVSEVAREMRKFGATLVIIDQMPASLDQETVRQLGSYFVFPLDSEEAKIVLPDGIPSNAVLSRLGAQGEAYVHGSAFLLPTFVQIKNYQEYARCLLANKVQKDPQAQTKAFYPKPKI